MRFLADFGGGAWSWPSCGSDLATRRARRERGRSLKISGAGKVGVRAGRAEEGLAAAVA